METKYQELVDAMEVVHAAGRNGDGEAVQLGGREMTAMNDRVKAALKDIVIARIPSADWKIVESVSSFYAETCKNDGEWVSVRVSDHARVSGGVPNEDLVFPFDAVDVEIALDSLVENF